MLMFHVIVIALSLIVGFVIIFCTSRWASRRDKSYDEQVDEFRKLKKLADANAALDSGVIDLEEYLVIVSMYIDEDEE